ncbi:MAG: hypothetical protein U1B78_01845 [Dehalococcoidia bacterium]|nr:hypothetical protein [Dehalococcoidia bacterium]
MQCATHPSVETELACGKCGKPICPRCLHHTPVGARCRQCANIRRLPTYQISAGYLARGAGAAAGAGAVLGVVWGVLLPFGPAFFLGLLVGLGLGYAIGEAVSMATNRKAGPPLQAVAAGGVVVAYLVRSALLASALRNVALIEIVTNDVFGYIVAILGVVVAMSRVR